MATIWNPCVIFKVEVTSDSIAYILRSGSISEKDNQYSGYKRIQYDAGDTEYISSEFIFKPGLEAKNAMIKLLTSELEAAQTNLNNKTKEITK